MFYALQVKLTLPVFKMPKKFEFRNWLLKRIRPFELSLTNYQVGCFGAISSIPSQIFQKIFKALWVWLIMANYREITKIAKFEADVIEEI